jgi:hypothetical protein
MATTTVSDALVFPQSQGTGLSSEIDELDATLLAALADHDQGEYVNTDLLNGCDFVNHDGANDTVDVDSGVVYIRDDSASTGGMRDGSGNPQGESSTSSGYDFAFPDHLYVVVLPTSTTVDVSDSTLNQVWINITDVTSQNSVEIRTDGGGGTTAEPSDTYLKIGEANPDDASASGSPPRPNDGANATFRSISPRGNVENTNHSLHSALSSGFHVGVSFGEGMVIKDPRNFTNDDEAAQACVDWLEANTNGGILHVPGKRPDGSDTTITSTVATDSTSNKAIGLYVHSGEGQGGGSTALQVTIDNGDPAFHIQGDVGNQTMRVPVRVDAMSCGGNTNEGLRLGSEWGGRCFIGRILNVGDVGLRITGGVNESQIFAQGIRTVGTGNTTQTGILLNNDANGNNGSDNYIYANVGDQFRDCILIEGDMRRNHIVGGHLEGADGATSTPAACIRIEGAVTHVHPAVVANGGDNGAHGIYVDGSGEAAPFNINPGLVSGHDGDGIHKNSNPARGIFGTQTVFNTINGDAISINNDSDPGDLPTTVPYESTVNATVNYPSTARSATYYPDGRRLLREGTATVNAGSSSEVESFAGQFRDAPEAHVWFDSDPNAVAGFTHQWTIDTNNDQHNLQVTETENNSSITVGFRVYGTDY